MAIDGQWKITTNTPMGAQEATAELQTAGDALTGTVSGAMFGSIPIQNGKVEGDTATWTISITSPMAMDLKHQATFTGDTVQGTVELGMFGKANFTGARIA